MSKTKPFTNMFGSEVQVTRTEFIVRWQDKLWDLGDLFMGTEYEEEFMSVIHHTHDLAGRKWDRAKPNDWAEEAEAHQHDNPLCGQ